MEFCIFIPENSYLKSFFREYYLGPSIQGLVTDGNTKICCHGFILALFQITTAIKIGFE